MGPTTALLPTLSLLLSFFSGGSLLLMLLSACCCCCCCCCFCLLMEPGGRPGPLLTGTPGVGVPPLVGVALGVLASSFSDFRRTAAEIKTEN